MSTDRLSDQFKQMQQTWQAEGELPVTIRRDYLTRLVRLLREHSDEISKALSEDFNHRSTHETYFLELFPSIKAIKYCLKHLNQWVKPKRKKVSYLFYPAKAYIYPQALGVVGNISPWNYPVYLALVPAAYALAAGNRVLIKVSELTPATGAVLAGFINKNFPETDLHIINGDVEIARAFSQLPFDHLIFTGSTSVGRQVMAAASHNLTPVTLELGGKSPAIISASCSPDYLARLLMGKCFNAGQTCIAPDYVLMPENFAGQFEQLAETFVQRHYPDMPHNQNFTSIISKTHYQRLTALIEDAREKGAYIKQFGEADEQQRKLPLTLIFNPTNDMDIMQGEIFGPLLPVVTYGDFDQAASLIRKHPNPLAMYYFGKDAHEISRLRQEHRSGALTINDTVMHIAIDDLPFGGVGESGMGYYHGREGFAQFSLMKPVFIQRRFSSATWLYPPYGKLMRLFLRWIGKLTIKE